MPRPSLPTVPEQPTEKVPVEALETLARHSTELGEGPQTPPSLSPFEIQTPDPRRRGYPSWIFGAMALVVAVAGGAAAGMRVKMTDAARGGSASAVASEARDAVRTIPSPTGRRHAGTLAPRAPKRRALGQPDR